jgi:lipopolysaccharide/colanic/teichoic acid biosynthesis glycosyltransferase
VLWVLLLLPVALVFAPVLFCWIKLTSPGPCIFRQTRIGRHSQPFTMYKFRTMHPEAATAVHEAHVAHLISTNQPLIKMDDEDGRLIKGACFVRMSGLDELPQLLNILRGEMSVVGPRPCVPSEFEFYDAHHLRRFAVPPGLTGIWQIERTRFTTFREMMAMDVGYIDHLSLWSDFKIIMKTPVAVFGRLTTSVRSKFGKSAIWVAVRPFARVLRRDLGQEISPSSDQTN